MGNHLPSNPYGGALARIASGLVLPTASLPASVTATPAELNTTSGGTVKKWLTATIAAAGNSQGTATLLTGDVNYCTGGNSDEGVRLPVPTNKSVVILITEIFHPVRVFPHVGGRINDNAINLHQDLGRQRLSVFVARSATDWYVDHLATAKATAETIDTIIQIANYQSEIADLSRSSFPFDTIYRQKIITTYYDFAEMGGAIGDIELSAELDNGNIILDGIIDIYTTFQTAGGDAGTIAISVENPDNIVTAIAVNDVSNPWDQGLHAIKPLGTASTAIKVTSNNNNIVVTIAGQAVTAGGFYLTLRYVDSYSV